MSLLGTMAANALKIVIISQHSITDGVDPPKNISLTTNAGDYASAVALIFCLEYH